jgi:CubicO group peptidase (beta-lactamase class C family)
MKRIFLLLLSLSILPTAGADPAAEAAEHHRDLQSEGEGIAIAVVKGDTTTFGAAGLLRQDGPPVGEDTLFEIGSISKVFTGISSRTPCFGVTRHWRTRSPSISRAMFSLPIPLCAR